MSLKQPKSLLCESCFPPAEGELTLIKIRFFPQLQLQWNIKRAPEPSWKWIMERYYMQHSAAKKSRGSCWWWAVFWVSSSQTPLVLSSHKALRVEELCFPLFWGKIDLITTSLLNPNPDSAGRASGQQRCVARTRSLRVPFPFSRWAQEQELVSMWTWHLLVAWIRPWETRNI